MPWGALISTGIGMYAQSQADAQARREAEKTTAAEREAYRQAQQNWDRWKTEYQPLMAEHIADVNGMNADHHANKLAGQVNAGHMGGMSEGLAQLNASGIDPSRGMFQDTANNMIGSAMTASAYDRARASTDTRSNYLNNLAQTLNIGQNIGSGAMQALGNSASMSGAAQNTRVNGGLMDGITGSARSYLNEYANNQFFGSRRDPLSVDER